MADRRRWMTDPELLGGTFGGESWAAWRALLAGFDGLPLSDTEAAIFRELTNREPPESALDELWLVIGRRGGKSINAGGLAVSMAASFDPRGLLAAGEVATLPIIAEDRKQARTIMRYVRGLFESSPMLKRLVVSDTAEGIELSTRVQIEVHTASFRTVRGYTLLSAILDEIAVWQHDGASPDSEILSALRPGLGTLNGRLIALSSPYARRGELWETFRENFGKDGSILVAKGPTRALNPLYPQSTIDRALAKDAPRARAEYLAEFRTDVETFVPREAVEACVEPGCNEDPPRPGVRYVGFVDPSGGSSDSMTLAIAHRENGCIMLDALRERKPPFSPADVTREFSDVLARYGLRSVTGDRYAGEWPRERFREHGVKYELADRPKSELYLALLPLINSRQARLLDVPRLVNQLVSLERRTARGGRDSVDHPQHGAAHDDIANACAGAIVLSAKRRRDLFIVVNGETFGRPRYVNRRVEEVSGEEFVPIDEVEIVDKGPSIEKVKQLLMKECAGDIIREIESRRVVLRIREGRLLVMRAHTQRLPGYLVRVARESEAEVVVYLAERAHKKGTERERLEAESEAHRRVAETKFMRAPLRLFPHE